jgi:hypothetical protein
MWKAACRAGFFLLFFLISAVSTFAAEGIKVETVLKNLDGPTTVAIRPDGTAESYEVFIAESGARRVIKVSNSKPSEIVEVVTGFPESSNGDGSGQAGNPRCLLFVDRERLATVVSGDPAEVRLFELNDAKEGLAAEEPTQVVRFKMPEGDSDGRSSAGVALARTRANDFVNDKLLVASGRVLLQLPLRAGTLGEMTALDTGNARTFTGNPTALAVSGQGYAVVAEEGPRSQNSAIVFLNPKTGKRALRVPTDLRKIEALAFSPKSGSLYAIGRNNAAGSKEGVFRIDDNRRPSPEHAAIGERIADAARPTALAFAPDGSLYFTLSGTASGGLLMRISGEL